jgi:hypothetical protein
MPANAAGAAGRNAFARAVASKRGNSTEGFGHPSRFVIDGEPPIGLLNLISQSISNVSRTATSL